MINKIRSELKKYKNKEKAKTLKSFFKTGKGGYSENEIFLGISVPILRKLSKSFLETNLSNLQQLLKSNIHEEKMMAILILIEQYPKNKDKIFKFYLRTKRYIDNWDLIDLSAPKIVGNYLYNKDRNTLYKLAKNKNFWIRRIAIVSTLYFIRHNDLKDAINLCELLLSDKYDMVQKPIGWMLREVGKKDKNILLKFLKQNYSKISRTSLRYAIEKFPENFRKKILLNKF